MKYFLSLTLTLLFLTNQSIASEKNPALASALSVIPGLGQIYSGEYDKGIGTMMGVLWVSSLCYGYGKRNNYDAPLFDADDSEDDKILYFIGGLAYVGVSIWSARDAYNTSNKLSLTPVITPRQISGRLSYAF